ncbi:MAG: hypothetical protein BLITH_1407 [Brockia lithotrophica]|uniref:Uncharacterized protein n=1 Tax=Brockia lithotrophica TaxID=933949 RepID=A0A2T5G6G8_9BACL|nr:MAG: hypothetical protein BLITH_1407 [Brockia lithotrophica]
MGLPHAAATSAKDAPSGRTPSAGFSGEEASDLVVDWGVLAFEAPFAFAPDEDGAGPPPATGEDVGAEEGFFGVGEVAAGGGDAFFSSPEAEGGIGAAGTSKGRASESGAKSCSVSPTPTPEELPEPGVLSGFVDPEEGGLPIRSAG